MILNRMLSLFSEIRLTCLLFLDTTKEREVSKDERIERILIVTTTSKNGYGVLYEKQSDGSLVELPLSETTSRGLIELSTFSRNSKA